MEIADMARRNAIAHAAHRGDRFGSLATALVPAPLFPSGLLAAWPADRRSRFLYHFHRGGRTIRRSDCGISVRSSLESVPVCSSCCGRLSRNEIAWLTFITSITPPWRPTFKCASLHDERTYAAQAAQGAFDLVDSLESRLSRFRINSDIGQIAHLAPGAKMRLSEPAFACLQIAKRMEQATHSAFCPTPAALKTQPSLPQWELLPDAAFNSLRERPARIRSGRYWQGIRSRSHGRTAPPVGLPLVFAGRGWQQHSGRRSACRYPRLVLWPG